MMRTPKPWTTVALVAALGLCACGARDTATGGPDLRTGMGGRSGDVRAQLAAAEKEVDRVQADLATRDDDLARAQREIEQSRRSERDLRESLQEARSDADALRQQLEAKGGKAAPAAAAAIPAEAQAGAEVARLERELANEQAKRLQAEQALNRLREETSANPYERAETGDSEALAAAQRQIDDLNQTLAAEREERADLERRYEELKTAQAAAAQAAAPASEEMGELQEQQRRMMAAIQQDLEASRRREEELKGQLAAAQGPEAGVLSDQLMDLRSENRALQSSLDEEHRANKELAAKLEVATRVADLIFKMRSEGQPVAADILKEAGAE